MKLNPSAWPIKNRTAIYVVTILLSIMGVSAYNNLPKEQFPEVKIPQIIIQTIYPGTSPANMENLVSKPIEKQLTGLTGIKKVTSNSFQDFSVITAEFNTDVNIDEAKIDVQDAVDKAKPDLPNNLPNEPEIKEIDVSDMPIMFVNLYGDYDITRMEKYADRLKDKIEDLKEIKRVDKVGGLEREIQINVDLFKMSAAQLSFRDIQNAVSFENVEATPGSVKVDGEQRLISVNKTFDNAEDIGNLLVKNPFGAGIYIKDIAEVKDTYEDADSYARLDGRNVITLNVVKGSGKNLINASEKIHEIIDEMQANEFPDGLNVITTAEQADNTKVTLHDLINTIIIGFILVTFILMFFMGTTNALFVALSVPLSMALAFMVLPTIGFTLNMIVLFAFLLALGIVVDDAIVVIENAHRIFHDEDLTITEAVKKATGEVFIPVLAGTVTTLLPFIPLAFWNGTIGEFMFFLPVTLIITLVASLVVAYIINPVFAVDFMQRDEYDGKSKIRWTNKTTITTIVFLFFAIIAHAVGNHFVGNLLIVLWLLVLLNKFILTKLIYKWQHNVWPKFQNWYVRILDKALTYKFVTLFIVIGIIIFSVVLMMVRPPKVEFFPQAEPNFTYVYLTMPEGTDIEETNKVLKQLEDKVYAVTNYKKDSTVKHPLIKSIVSNVKVGATDQNSGEIGDYPNRGKITLSYVKFADRNGLSTQNILDSVRQAIQGIPGAKITVDKESSGPPTPKPIVIEITGENIDTLIATSRSLKKYLADKQIGGVEELKSDFQANKPEIVFDIQRERLNSEGISTGQVAGDLRTSLFGSEISRFKDANDDYPIMLRLQKDQRNNISIVKNLPITYRDMGMGGIVRQVPLGSFASLEYGNTYGGIKRKDEERIITLSSNVTSEFNGNEVVAELQGEIDDYPKPAGVQIRMAGEQEEQAETMSFLGNAMLMAISLIFLILLVQFNSLSRSLIIMSAIVLSIVGVLLGMGITGMNFVIVMTGIGIIALAGIVVRNGILLVEFTDLKLEEGLAPKDALLEAGRTRMTPVLLTAASTISGLIPLAVGLNMDFVTLLESGNPHLYFGGDSVAFWGPLAWTMIFGLAFATVITLIIIPVLMLMALNRKKKILIALGRDASKL